VLNLKDDDCDSQVDDGTGTALAEYRYDTSNLRVATKDATESRRILLDHAEELGEYMLGAGAARYERDPMTVDNLLGPTVEASTTHAISDALGSIYGIADSTSAQVSRYRYDVFGARTSIMEDPSGQRSGPLSSPISDTVIELVRRDRRSF